MNGNQIFISHQSNDTECAIKLYDDLLESRYWVWVDKKNLEAGEEWETQIKDNLEKSKTFIVLFSSNSINSDWVKHEGSMACAYKHRIIPVNIEPSPKYSKGKLPIWAKPIQLLELYIGSPQYADQLEKLKEKLDKPLSVQKYLLDQIDHYQRDGTLLDEVGFELVVRHYDKLHLTNDQRKITDKLIEDTSRLSERLIFEPICRHR
jgi:hypothetical protein